MASKSKDEASNKLLWLAGGAAITGAVMYLVTKNLGERDELNRLRYAEGQRKLTTAGEE